jgi:hypothetical protein
LIFVQIGSSTFDADVVCALTASSDGTVGGVGPGCSVPNVPAGVQPLIAIDDQNQAVRVTGHTFKVTPILLLTPQNSATGAAASPGSTVTVQGHGFAASSTVSAFKFGTAALVTSPTSVSTDANGNFTAAVTFIVPSTAAVGANSVKATDGSANAGSATLAVFKPTVSVTPTSGSPGTQLTVSGGGWPAGDLIFVQTGSSQFDVDVVCAATADASGTIALGSTSCPVPNVPAGTYPLVAIDDQMQAVRTTGANFTVSPTLVLTPQHSGVGAPASPGAIVSVQGHGFAANSSVSGFKFDGAALTTSPASVTTDSNGTFTAPVTFTVPATAAGSHTVTGTDGTNAGSAGLTVFTPTFSVSPGSGASGAGLTVSGSGWPAGDLIFVQIGSTTFDVDVVCALTVTSDGTILGNQPNANCKVPAVGTGSQPLVAIDDQNQGVAATHANFTVTSSASAPPPVAGATASSGSGSAFRAIRDRQRR